MRLSSFSAIFFPLLMAWLLAACGGGGGGGGAPAVASQPPSNQGSAEYDADPGLRLMRVAEAYAMLGTPDDDTVSPSGAGVTIGFRDNNELFTRHPELLGKFSGSPLSDPDPMPTVPVRDDDGQPGATPHATAVISLAVGARGVGASGGPSPQGFHGIAPGARYAWRDRPYVFINSPSPAPVPIISESRGTVAEDVWTEAAGEGRDSWLEAISRFLSRLRHPEAIRHGSGARSVKVNSGGNSWGALSGPADGSLYIPIATTLFSDAGRQDIFNALGSDIQRDAGLLASLPNPTLLVAVEVHVNGRHPGITTACGPTQDYCLATPSRNSLLASVTGGTTASPTYGYARGSGTSFSAPRIAGALAVLAEKVNGADCMRRWPDASCLQMTIPQLAQRLLDTANRGPAVRTPNRPVLNSFKRTLDQLLEDPTDGGTGRAALVAMRDAGPPLPDASPETLRHYYTEVVAPLELTPFYQARYDAMAAAGMERDAILEEMAFSALLGAGVLDLEAAVTPVGTLSVATGPQVDGASVRLADTQMHTAPAFGDALHRGLAGLRLAAFDSQGFPFWHDAPTRLATAEAESTLTRLARLDPPDARADAAPAPAFGLRQTAVRHGALFASATAGPFLGFTAAHLDLGSLRFGFGTGPSGGAGPSGGGSAPGGAGPESDDARPFTAIVERELSSGGLAVRLRGGLLREPAGLWGLSGKGAFITGAGTTAFAGLAMEAGLGAGVRLEAEAALGAGRQGGAVAVAGLARASAFSAALMRDGTLAAGDTLALRVSQPLRAEGGALRVRLPTGRTPGGGVVRRTADVDLAPSGREVAVDLAWQGSAAGGSLALVAGAVMEPGHVAAAKPQAHALARQTWTW